MSHSSFLTYLLKPLSLKFDFMHKKLFFFILSFVLPCWVASAQENKVAVEGGQIWYEVIGDGEAIPVILIHGGPGGTSLGFEPLKELDYKGPLVFWDQLGSGRSDAISDTLLMTIENYVEQLENLRKHLDFEKFILYGHSWGTMLGMDYVLAYPERVAGIIFSSPLMSTASWVADADTLIATLPDSVQQTIRRYEAMENFEHPAYQDAVKLYYSLYVTRKPRKKPTSLQKSQLTSGKHIYEYMWGPSEFTARGTLKNYDRLNKLGQINVPTLFLTGEYDEARPSTVASYQQKVPGARLVIIQDAAHSTLNDNPEMTMRVIKDFLDKMN